MEHLGFQINWEKVRLEPKDKYRVFGFCGGLDNSPSKFARRQTAEHSTALPRSPTERSNFCTRTSEIDRQNDSDRESDSSGTIAYEEITDAEIQGSTNGSTELWNSNNTDSGIAERSAMVVGRDRCLERENVRTTVSGLDVEPDVRCVEKRLGCHMQRQTDPGSLVSRGAIATHKCVRAESGYIRGSGIYKGNVKSTCPCTSGQHNDGCQYQQDGKHQVKRHVGEHDAIVGILPEEGDHNYCGISTGGLERTSRQGIQNVSRFQQLDFEEGILSNTSSEMGSVSIGSVCRQTELPVATFCELETGSGCSDNGRIYADLDTGLNVCVSSVLPDKSGVSQSSIRQGRDGPNHTVVASTTMVRESVEHDDRQPHNVTTSSTPTIRSESRISSDDHRREVATGGMANLRETWKEQGFSEGTVEILQQSRRLGTQATYNSAWKKWSSWCNERGFNPFQCSMVDILDFLTESVESGLEYATINGYRSALSAYHPQIEGFKVGQHPTVCTFMTGVFNKNPPKPRYSETWDVDKVLNHIRSMGDNAALTDKKLSYKLTMLLALSNANRAHEIRSLNPKYLQDFGDRIVWPIEKLTKSKRQSKPEVSITLVAYEEESLNVISCLRIYLSRTTEWRTTEAQKSQLLLGMVKPHNPVTTSTVSRWLRELMNEAGIDTEVFKAHSVRGASTSKVANAGLSVQQILEKANWSNARTFRRFYYRESIDDNEVYQNKLFKLKR